MADKAVFGTSKGAGATSDHTDLISTVVLKREGKTLPSSVETGELGKSIIFTKPAKGDVIYWEAETLCDNEPTSDRITVALTFYDPIYIGKLTDIVIDKLSNAEIDQIINGDESPIEKHLTPILDVAQALKQVYSTTVITDSSGKAAGEIPIDEKMQFADYTLTIHYGYAGRAEQSDSGKEYDFWVEEVGLMIVEVVAIIALTFMTAGVGTAIVGGIATAAAIGDIAVAASNYFANGFGAIDENRKGCLFPLMGWNHTYAFVLDEPILNEDGTESNEITESMISQLSPSTEQKINEIKTQYGLQGTSTNLLLVGILAPLLLLVLIPRRKSKSKSKKSKPKEETSDE
tara:strand:- start:530 stop:1567 length:1038 start_codon:yes stop_codon:yes gene_type:complete